MLHIHFYLTRSQPGLVKLIPVQFGRFSLRTLLVPWGELRQYWVLWTFMAYSPLYTMFAGAVEVLSGSLLFFRRTALLGALLTLAAMTNVLMLNIGYGVSVKLFATNLVLASMFLRHYDARSLFDFFIRRRPRSPDTAVEGSSGRPWRVMATLALLVILMTTQAIRSLRRYREFDAEIASTKAVSGLYDVVDVRTAGKPVPVAFGDHGLWQRVAIQGNGAFVQLMSDSLQFFRFRMDSVRRELHFRQRNVDRESLISDSLTFAYDVRVPESMALHGILNGRDVTISLRRFDKTRYRLGRATFHWFDE